VATLLSKTEGIVFSSWRASKRKSWFEQICVCVPALESEKWAWSRHAWQLMQPAHEIGADWCCHLHTRSDNRCSPRQKQSPSLPFSPRHTILPLSTAEKNSFMKLLAVGNFCRWSKGVIPRPGLTHQHFRRDYSVLYESLCALPSAK